MARIRTIKPEFFQHDGLADLPRDVRLLFIGLWTITDRDGRMQDRPRRLRLTLFPGDADVTAEVIDDWLWQLAEHEERFIVRYEVGGERFIEVRNFTTHQRPHPKESASEILASDDEEATTRCRGEVRVSREKVRQASQDSEGFGASPEASIVHSPLSIPASSSQKIRNQTRGRAKPSMVAPDDFAPDEATVAVGRDIGLDEDGIVAELAKFRDHEFKTPHTDWQKAARNWLRRAAEMRPNGTTRGSPRFAAEVTADNVRRLLEESIEEDRKAAHDKG